MTYQELLKVVKRQRTAKQIEKSNEIRFRVLRSKEQSQRFYDRKIKSFVMTKLDIWQDI
jgi:DNA-directed RNA polymerase subunit E'/Rpb7